MFQMFASKGYILHELDVAHFASFTMSRLYGLDARSGFWCPTIIT